MLFKPRHLFGEIVFYLMDSTHCAFLCSHKQVGGIYFIFVETAQSIPTDWVYLFYGIYLVVPEHYPQKIIGISQIDIYGITFYAEVATVQLDVVSYV